MGGFVSVVSVDAGYLTADVQRECVKRACCRSCKSAVFWTGSTGLIDEVGGVVILRPEHDAGASGFAPAD